MKFLGNVDNIKMKNHHDIYMEEVKKYKDQETFIANDNARTTFTNFGIIARCDIFDQ